MVDAGYGRIAVFFHLRLELLLGHKELCLGDPTKVLDAPLFLRRPGDGHGDGRQPLPLGRTRHCNNGVSHKRGVYSRWQLNSYRLHCGSSSELESQNQCARRAIVGLG